MAWWTGSAEKIQDVLLRRDRVVNRRNKRRKRILTPNRSMSAKDMHIPVMVRGNVAGIPFQPPSRSKTRHQTHVALNVRGAEIRLPALPQIRFGWRLVSGAIASGIIFILYVVWSTPLLSIGSLEINGLQRLSVQEINTFVSMDGEQIFMVNPEKLEKELKQAFPEFISVEVGIRLPNGVDVVVEERTPILIWKQEGKSVLIDANGFAFPLRAGTTHQQEPAIVVEAYTPPPTYSGLQAELEEIPFIPVEMVSALISLSAIAPSGTPLIYDEQHGFGWKERKGWEIYFGDTQDIDIKLNVYKSLVKKFKQEKIEPQLVSIEYVNAPYYRMER